MDNEDFDPHAAVQELRNDAHALEQSLGFQQELQALEARLGQLQTLQSTLTSVRSRGFLWWPSMEQQLQQAQQQAQGVRRSVQQATGDATRTLRQRAAALSRSLGQLHVPHRANERFNEQMESLASECESLQAERNAAAGRVQALAQPLEQALASVEQGLRGAVGTLDEFDKASFRVRADESPLCAAWCTWEDSPRGAVESMLFLTDTVLRVEALPPAGGGARVLLLEMPAGALVDSTDSERGWLFKDEVLTLTPRQGSGFPRLTLVFKSADSKLMDDLVEKMRSGELNAHRVARPGGGAAQQADTGRQPVRWAQQCEACGAAIEPPLRGQAQVTCAYCRRSYPVEFA